MQVIAPPAIQWNPQGPPPPYGYFSPSNIVYRSDGFYYAMFQTSTPSASYGVCLVRTQDLADPTSWRAWDGSGFNLQFLDPYTGPAGQFCPDVVGWGNPGTLTYNTYLERYMWVTFGFIGTGTPQDLCAFLLSSSKDLIHWSPMRILRQTYFPFFAPHCFPPKSVPSDDYAAIIDQNDSTINFEAPGENPDLYYTRFNDYPTNLYDRDLVRRTMTITVPDIAVEVSPSLTTAFSGQAANFFGSLRTSNGNNQPADLSCGIGHPAICGPSSPSLLPSASGTAFTVTASDTTPGDYKFDVIADGAYMTRSQALELRVIDFAISAPMPSSINVAQGNPSAPIQLSVTGLGPFDRSVTFSCAGLPAGANCLFSPSDTIHPGSGSPANVMLIINSNTASVGGPVNVTISAAAAGDPRPAKTTSLQLTITNGSGVSADLSAAITHANPPSNQPLGVGQQIIWKAVAMNHGPSNNIPSILLVTFSNVVSLGPAPAGCTNNSQTNSVSCAASLNSGSSSGFNIPVVVPFTHDVTAMAVVSSAASDPGPGNNLSSDTVQVRPRPLARRGLPVANP
jgi:hypothetical protein